MPAKPKLGEAERRLAGVRNDFRNYLIAASVAEDPSNQIERRYLRDVVVGPLSGWKSHTPRAVETPEV